MAKNKKNTENIFTRIGHGKLLSVGFFRRHWGATFLIIGLFIIFISSKFKTQTDIEQILKLTNELNRARVGLVNASAEYNTRIREPQMVNLVDSLGLDLAMPEKPHYKL